MVISCDRFKWRFECVSGLIPCWNAVKSRDQACRNLGECAYRVRLLRSSTVFSRKVSCHKTSFIARLFRDNIVKNNAQCVSPELLCSVLVFRVSVTWPDINSWLGSPSSDRANSHPGPPVNKADTSLSRQRIVIHLQSTDPPRVALFA